MGSDQNTFIGPVFSLVLGPCDRCGKDNKSFEHRLADYKARGLILTNLCICCCFKQREAKRRAAELKRPAEKAMTKTAKAAEEMTEAAPNAVR